MPKLFAKVVITQFDDDGHNRAVDSDEISFTTRRRYLGEAICTALLDHLDDEIKWQDEHEVENG